MKKVGILFILAMLVSYEGDVTAQTTSQNKVSMSFLYTQFEHWTMLSNTSNTANMYGLHIECDRKISANCDLGLGCDIFSAAYHSEYDYDDLSDHLVLAPSIVGTLHLLDLMGWRCSSIDLMLKGNIGGVFASGCDLQYGIGVGLDYYPFEHFGIGATGSFGRYPIVSEGFTNHGSFQAFAGISYRW